MTPREPVPETTPRVGRWQYWLCGCTSDFIANRMMLPEEERCRACGFVRPPASAPVVETGVRESEPEMVERAAREVYERDADVGTWPWTALPVLARANLMQYVRAGAALRAPRPGADGAETAKHRSQGLTPEMVEAHYPTSQHQFDECETCRAIHDIAKEALSRPTPDGAPSDG